MHSSSSFLSVRRLLDACHLVGAAMLYTAVVAGGAATAANLVSASVGDSLDGPAITLEAADPVHYSAMELPQRS